MIDFINKGGPGMYIIIIFILVIIALTVKKIMDLYINKGLSGAQLESGINAIIFWGAISAILGYFFHFLGLYYAMGAIAVARDISPAIVSMGYQFSLVTVLSGLFTFLMSAIIWFIFRARYKKLAAGME